MERADAVQLLVGFPAQLFGQTLLQQLRRQQIPGDDRVKIALYRVEADITAVVKSQAYIGLLAEKGVKNLALPVQQQAVYLFTHEVFDGSLILPALHQKFQGHGSPSCS